MSTVDRLLPDNSDRLFIDGEWVRPHSERSIDVVDSNNEEPFLRVAEADAADMSRAIAAARTAFDFGPWPRLSHAQRGEYLREIAAHLRSQGELLADLWSRESGIIHSAARESSPNHALILEEYAEIAGDYPWEKPGPPLANGMFTMLVREPVGVVAAIVPWNAPLPLALHKVAPALLAGCTVVLKPPPEAPGAALVIAEAARLAGLPPGVLNVLVADRDVSEQLVRDPRIDMVGFTGSTEVGRRIATIMADRIGRYALELGGKSAAVILDDADLHAAATSIANAECRLTGQVCASLTRLIVTRDRHDDFVDALADVFSKVRVGDAFDPETQMGPLVSGRQRDRVEGYVEIGVKEGAKLVTGGGRPRHLDRGFFIEPTVFAQVDNQQTIAREEIFGPVLSVISAADEADAIRLANDTIYGLNAAVFTPDVDRAREVAAQLRSGTVGHNGYFIAPDLALGGFKQSGIGRSGGLEGLLPFLETKTLILDGPPERHRNNNRRIS